ncbi:hypothetical protein [Pendulispora albinea]|uniref:DUF4238 domain-containing protein n=1 Tax=Pendulispora albinea TaxID=2741071 RepID=A0ABZ2M413_9BACT
MSVLELDGLIGSHPLGALASFGLLRVLTRQGGEPRLYFEERDDWVARIECEHASVDDLIGILAKWSRSSRDELLSWAKADVRVPLEEYRAVLARALGEDHELANFLSALAADGAVDKSKGLIKPTAFYMASGQQNFIETMQSILTFVREAPSKVWREALVGPWAYSAPIWGAGWDPGTERMHALRHKAPTKDKTSCVPGAVWLAFEALPLFPSFTRDGRDRTVGFVLRDRVRHWRWPVPIRPVTLDALAMLVSSREVASATEARRREGIGAVYESTRSEFGQGYAVFRPARRIV